MHSILNYHGREMSSSIEVTPSRNESTKLFVERQIKTIEELLPPNIKEKVQPYTGTISSILVFIIDLIEKLIPLIKRAYEKALEFWELILPYHPQLLVPSLFGIILCFFGGSFLTVIAAAEAYRQCGYQTTLDNILLLIADAKRVYAASKKDDDIDADGDGKKDVLQISAKELAQRKVLLFLKTVDPNRITAAAYGIQTSFLAVAATLKLEFAKTITLGNSIAEIVSKPVHQYLVPKLEKLVPAEYRQWVKPSIDSVIKASAISFAWTLQRILSAVHSALRGGLMCSRNVIEYLGKLKVVQINHEETVLDEVAGYALAALGLYFQLSSGFRLPFPLNIILFPLSMVEYLLLWFISK